MCHDILRPTTRNRAQISSQGSPGEIYNEQCNWHWVILHSDKSLLRVSLADNHLSDCVELFYHCIEGVRYQSEQYHNLAEM